MFTAKLKGRSRGAVKSDIAEEELGSIILTTKLSLVLRTLHTLGGKRRNTIGRTEAALGCLASLSPAK
jgi:hypothetical protein